MLFLLSLNGCFADGYTFNNNFRDGSPYLKHIPNVNLSPYPSWYSLYRNTPYADRRISDILGDTFYADLMNLEQSIGHNRQKQVESSQRDEKRNSSPKKNGKGEFDSNSYFMLRPLRREPMEQHERSDISRFIGNFN